MLYTKLQNVLIRYPTIYKPKDWDGIEKYGCAFVPEHDDAIQLERDGLRPKQGEAMFNTTSKFQPLVTCRQESDYEILEKAMKIAEIRNMAWDNLFIDVTTDILVGIFEYENNYTGQTRSGKAMALIEIYAEPKQMLKNVLTWTKDKV